jgi:hypothetical protein
MRQLLLPNVAQVGVAVRLGVLGAVPTAVRASLPTTGTSSSYRRMTVELRVLHLDDLDHVLVSHSSQANAH